ncbi:hypothetical protein PR048_005481 [Dryococelus australis]|uniref:Uncharacterized protein n=1 Tax=Dryococelus australis TaxID=614101 RepID=A0ABQ9I9I2_9NEOP|nr:hypothetical protein PR048_005481 [Dryococelus australis]
MALRIVTVELQHLQTGKCIQYRSMPHHSTSTAIDRRLREQETYTVSKRVTQYLRDIAENILHREIESAFPHNAHVTRVQAYCNTGRPRSVRTPHFEEDVLQRSYELPSTSNRLCMDSCFVHIAYRKCTT